MHVLTQEDWDFWQANGYVIIHDAVPPENVEATVNFLWKYTGRDRNDPQTWYAKPDDHVAKLNGAGMIEVYQHQTLWNNRQSPRIYGAFADIWGTDKLWVSIDRANLNLPVRRDEDFKGFVHWDVDTRVRPLPFNVQGVLSLVDVTEEQGGLQVVPGFHNIIEEWLETQPADRDPWHPDITGFELKHLATKAGDLVIWHSLLPHGTGRNTSDRPRIAQYITMSPAKEDDEALRQERVTQWEQHRAPGNRVFPGDARQWEEQHGVPAELTPLGRKLLGADPW